MNRTMALLAFSLIGVCSVPDSAPAAEIDARPPNRLTLTASRSRQDEVDDGGIFSLNYLHYLTPVALFGLGAEHQYIEDATLTFGSARAAWGRGEPGSKTTLFGETHYGNGDDDGRDFGYSIYVLGVSQALSPQFFVELEARYLDIDTTNGRLPKLGISYLWTPRLLTYISYAKSFGGNLGTELTSGRINYYGSLLSLKAGASTGHANPAVLVLQPGVTLPAQQSKQAYVGIGKAFKRGEVELLADYLETGPTEKMTLTLSFTAYLGARVPR
jgi:outer membrane receptor protein involved in Fe transport